MKKYFLLILERSIDIFLSIILLLLLSPLMIVVAILIKIESKGPVIFKQHRNGQYGKIFTIYKFRTMKHSNCKVFKQAERYDVRITTLGKVLRKISIDELPQLVNTLKGDMSLVGPRPHPLPLDTKYSSLIDNYMDRYNCKPGITGFSQINDLRGETDFLKMKKRFMHDMYYVNNHTLALYFKILFTTPFKVLLHKNSV